MCGICGRYNFRDQTPVDPEAIIRMTRTLAHRGPDDEGYYVAGAVGLGFRRLSIIDLDGGRQPMADETGEVWVVFNGEIYNFKELRNELERFGYRFKTKSDTEVIVHGYRKWGIKVFDHLNGMFGVAIWDEKRKRLVLARDPMGIKFVYYKCDSGSINFGSEIRAVLAGDGNGTDIDPGSLNLFLRYRYTPSPHTLFKGIRKLAPGTMMVLEHGRDRLVRWYQFKPSISTTRLSVSQAKFELLDLYKKSVKRHLISDVPLGLLLSGGIDSGLLLGLMNLNGDSWPTFTVGYGRDFKDDELHDAHRTAEIFSSRHASLQLDRETFESSLPKIISYLEEPIASSSIVPMYFICERARQDVKVALIGQGPDELFGGYPRHLGVRYGAYWRSLPRWLRIQLTNAVNAMPRNESLKRGVYSLNVAGRLRRYQHVFSILPGQAIDNLFYDGLLSRDTGDRILDCWNDLEPLMENTDELGGLQFLELRSSLPDELLLYADKLSMAHGLEVRVPYLDREIVEYVEGLPANLKVRNGIRKWLHREVCREFVPKTILKRKKRGFAVSVVDQWFRESFNERMNDILLNQDSLMFSYLQPKKVHQLFYDHRSGRSNNYKILFSLVVFEEWLRTISVGRQTGEHAPLLFGHELPTERYSARAMERRL